MSWARHRVNDAFPLRLASGHGTGEVAGKQLGFAGNPVVAHATMVAAERHSSQEVRF